MNYIQSINRNTQGVAIQIYVPFSESMLNGEEVIQMALNEAGTAATKALLEEFDTDGSPIHIGSARMTSKGKVERDYQTPFGVATVARHVYQTQDGGKTFCPLDQNARIVLSGTPKLAKMLSSKYTDMGASRVAQDMEENHQRKISKGFVQNTADAIGAVIFAKQESWNYSMPELEEQITTVAIGLDGTTTYINEDGYRQVMVGTIALYDKDGNRQHTIYTAAAPEYGKKTFISNFDHEIDRIKKKYPHADYVGVADGAKDNWDFLNKHTGFQVLDFWHASEYLARAATILYPLEKDSQERATWLSSSCHNLKHKHRSAGKIVDELTLRRDEKKMRSHQKEELNTVITYFKNNKKRMNYAQATENNFPIGSGVTEAACKVIAKQRLGNSGMKWSERGAAVVLTLRCLAHSTGRWDQFWGKVDRFGYPLAA
jgi:hypothetical protein